MEISKTTRFNTCKKVAQLQRVIGVFSMQIQDKRFMKECLIQRIDEKFAEIRNNYSEKMEKDVLAKVPNTSDLEAKEKTRIEEKINKMKNDISSKSNEITTKAENIIKELEQLMIKLSEIAGPVLAQTKTLIDQHNQIFDATQDLLKNKVSEMRKVYKEEVSQLTKESEAKERQYVIDSRAKFDQMRSDHAVLMDNLRNEKPMPKLSAKEKEQLAKQRKRLEQLSDVVKQLFEEATYLKGAHRMFLQQSKSRFKDVMKIGQNTTSKVDEKELERIRKEVNEQCAIFMNELNEQKQQLSNLKAELEYKYQKIKAEVSETLRKMQEEFLKKKNQRMELMGQGTAELDALKEQNKKEIAELKERFAQEEAVRTLAEKEKAKTFEAIKKDLKSEKVKLKKELKNVQTQNAQEKAAKTEELNKIIDETKAKNLKEEKELKDQITSLEKGGNQQESQQKEELKRAKKERDDALKFKQEKLKQFDEETNAIKDKHTTQNKSEISSLNKGFDDEFSLKSKECELTLAQLRNEKQKIQDDLRNNYHNIYNEAMNKIRASYQDNYENDESIVSLKNECADAQNALAQIKSPNPSNNEFIQLNTTIDNLKKEIDRIISKNGKEKAEILSKYQSLIDDEEKRHREALTGSSGRGRDQVKQSFRNKISETIASREEKEKELRSILDALEKERILQQNNYEKEMEEVNDSKYIDSLKTNKEIEENRIETTIQEEKEKTKKLIEELKKMIEEVKTLLQNHSVTNERNTEIENDSFEKTKNDLLQKLESLKENSGLSETQYAQKLSKEAENRSAQYEKEVLQHQKQLNDLENKIKRSLPTYEMFVNDSIKRCASDLKKIESEQNAELHKLNCNKKGLTDFYDEKIQVLEDELSELAKHFDITAPRECDLEEIKNLQQKLTSTTAYLKTLLKDFMQVKSLIVSRENEYNQRFGCMPKIGTMKLAKGRSQVELSMK